jgi:peptide/nickel transport system substrate-binding protein
MTRLRGLGIMAALLLALAAVAALIALPAGAQESGQDSEEEENVLRFGWAQDPQTLNPFVDLDSEDFTIWAMNWDLLVNFDPEELSPKPGIAESWEVSEDRKTVTFHLDPDAVWSDGEPVTSEDVKWSLENLGGEGVLFTDYVSNITSVRTPDDETVVVETSQPDARLVGGLFIYIMPEHIWGDVPIDELTGDYDVEMPMVGTGPFIVTEFEHGRMLTMERNPNFRGEQPEWDRIEFIKYGNDDAAERALQLGEVDIAPGVQSATFERLAEDPNIETVNAPAPSYTELAFNLCSEQHCPDAEFNPAVQDRAVRQAIGYAVDRERINEIATLGTSFVAHGILPSYYKAFYTEPEQDYPYDPEQAEQILDDAGWELNDDGIREKDGEVASFDLYARSDAPSEVQMARLVAEQTAEVGIEFNVQVVSTDKLTELTVRKVDGKPAPEFDTFIWGWGGDPYDPSTLLSLLTTDQIGGSSDSFYSNREYDRLYDQQNGVFDTEERREIIERMIAITQRDLPYLVLTEDPALQGYRTDRLANVEPVCPAETGDIYCDQVSYEPLLTITPADGASSDDGGGSTGLMVAIAAVVVAGIGYLVFRSRRRRAGEPLELEE